jgi:hypothetical protein
VPGRFLIAGNVKVTVTVDGSIHLQRGHWQATIPAG